jgi:hypothetical protein
MDDADAARLLDDEQPGGVGRHGRHEDRKLEAARHPVRGQLTDEPRVAVEHTRDPGAIRYLGPEDGPRGEEQAGRREEPHPSFYSKEQGSKGARGQVLA